MIYIYQDVNFIKGFVTLNQHIVVHILFLKELQIMLYSVLISKILQINFVDLLVEVHVQTQVVVVLLLQVEIQLLNNKPIVKQENLLMDMFALIQVIHIVLK